MTPDRFDKLKKFKDKRDIEKIENLRKLATADFEFMQEREDFIQELGLKIIELKDSLGTGIRISELDSLIVELEQLGNLKEAVNEFKDSFSKIKFPDYPKSIEVKGIQDLIKALNKPQSKESTTIVTTKLDKLIKAVKDNTVKQGQTPSDYIPTRRVMKVGNTLMYDDSFYTGGGGGGSNDFITQDNLPAQVKLTAEGNVPVDIQDASITATLTNDGTFATPTKQDTGNTSLAGIKTQTDKLTFTGNKLQVDAVLDSSEINIGQVNVLDSSDNEINPAKEDGILAEIAVDTDNLAGIKTDTATISAKDFATQTTLALIKAKTDNLDVLLSTRTKPADAQHVIVDSGVTTGLTDTQLRASAVPVSNSSLPLPTGAATSAAQLPNNHNVVVTSAPTTAVTGPLTDTQLRATAVPISSASLPLPSGASTAANQLIGLMPKIFDALTYTATSGTVDTYSYFTGGIGGSLVATLTVTFTAADHLTLVSAVRT